MIPLTLETQPFKVAFHPGGGGSTGLDEWHRAQGTWR